MKKPTVSRKGKDATPKPTRCAIYARSATHLQANASNSIAKQIRTCTEYAEQGRGNWGVLKLWYRYDEKGIYEVSNLGDVIVK